MLDVIYVITDINYIYDMYGALTGTKCMYVKMCSGPKTEISCLLIFLCIFQNFLCTFCNSTGNKYFLGGPELSLMYLER